MIQDTRDKRVISPYQCWSVPEIMDNSAGTINVMTERDQILAPSRGYFFTLHGVYTVSQFKCTVNLQFDIPTSVPCAAWDQHAASILGKDERFQPFQWPITHNHSPTYVDVKVKMENNLFIHLVWQGFRSDNDLTLITNYWNEAMIDRCGGFFTGITVFITVFQGWRVSAVSFEAGRRAYALSANGVVCALDYVRSRSEIGNIRRNAPEALGNDPDLLDFRFVDASARVCVRGYRMSVPPTWLVVSHLSGPALVALITTARENGGRIEGPAQAAQFSQLAAIHESWYQDSFRHSVHATDRCGLFEYPVPDDADMHRVIESKLVVQGAGRVHEEALALGDHAPEQEEPFIELPPALEPQRGAIENAVALNDQIALADLAPHVPLLASMQPRQHQSFAILNDGELGAITEEEGSPEDLMIFQNDSWDAPAQGPPPAVPPPPPGLPMEGNGSGMGERRKAPPPKLSETNLAQRQARGAPSSNMMQSQMVAAALDRAAGANISSVRIEEVEAGGQQLIRTKNRPAGPPALTAGFQINSMTILRQRWQSGSLRMDSNRAMLNVANEGGGLIYLFAPQGHEKAMLSLVRDQDPLRSATCQLNEQTQALLDHRKYKIIVYKLDSSMQPILDPAEGYFVGPGWGMIQEERARLLQAQLQQVFEQGTEVSTEGGASSGSTAVVDQADEKIQKLDEALRQHVLTTGCKTLSGLALEPTMLQHPRGPAVALAPLEGPAEGKSAAQPQQEVIV